MCYNLVVSKVNKNNKNLGSGILNLLLGLLLLSFLIIPGYLFYTSFVNKDGSLPTASEIIETISNQNSPNISSNDWESSESEDTDTEDVYEEDPVLGENFFEKLPVIDDQQTYIAIPMRVDTETPPAIVIYNHGDLEVVKDSVSGEFMEKLREYSRVFTSNNYVFAASDIHNNDNTDSPVGDIHSLIEWIQENYTSSTDIYLIGFSRGGYATTNYVLEYPEEIRGFALLAPATYYTEWGQSEVNKIIDTPLKIWHGTADVNIGIIHSYNFINQLKEYGKDVEIEEKEGKTHFEVDDEYIDEILDFFESTLQE